VVPALDDTSTRPVSSHPYRRSSSAARPLASARRALQRRIGASNRAGPVGSPWFHFVAYPELGPLHAETQRGREARIDKILSKLIAAGLLDGERVKQRLPQLRLQIFTQVFFWLPSAILSAPDRDPAERLDLHARAAMALLLPACTPSRRRRLETLLDRPRGTG
jgi:hypothetical protein